MEEFLSDDEQGVEQGVEVPKNKESLQQQIYMEESNKGKCYYCSRDVFCLYLI